jgi:hypothetical protein
MCIYVYTYTHRYYLYTYLYTYFYIRIYIYTYVYIYIDSISTHVCEISANFFPTQGICGQRARKAVWVCHHAFCHFLRKDRALSNFWVLISSGFFHPWFISASSYMVSFLNCRGCMVIPSFLIIVPNEIIVYSFIGEFHGISIHEMTRDSTIMLAITH